VPSVGRNGDSDDNALAETINGLHKTYLIHLRAHWTMKEAVERATLEWVHWFNHHRLLKRIGPIPLARGEANLDRILLISPPTRGDRLTQPNGPPQKPMRFNRSFPQTALRYSHTNSWSSALDLTRSNLSPLQI